MILDTSAIIAVLTQEPDAERLLDKLQSSKSVSVGAPTLTETSVVLSGRMGSRGITVLERFLEDLGASVIPFGELHWREAAVAYQQFGKGRHPAALNFGDCMAYAVARIARQPLLCIGNDFSKTDLEIA